jgi:hypothetical protein
VAQGALHGMTSQNVHVHEHGAGGAGILHRLSTYRHETVQLCSRQRHPGVRSLSPNIDIRRDSLSSCGDVL